MYKQLKTYLNRPFPIMETLSIKLIMPFAFGGFVFLFLYIFKPFGLSVNTDQLLFASLGFGIITLLITFANNFILPLVLTKIFGNKSYTIAYNITTSIFYLATIGTANWFFYFYFLTKESKTDSILQFIFYTVTIGIFPMIIGAYITEKRMNKHNNDTADILNKNINTDKKNTAENYNDLVFTSEVNSDLLKINSNEIICIKSDGNYCEFYTQEKPEIKKVLMRFTMKNAANILENSENIIRVHRSYFVNINKVSHISGTARNISLHIDNLEFSIPVSRINEHNVTNAISHNKKQTVI